MLKIIVFLIKDLEKISDKTTNYEKDSLLHRSNKIKETKKSIENLYAKICIHLEEI